MNLFHWMPHRLAAERRGALGVLWAVLFFIILSGFTALFVTLLIDQRQQVWERSGVAASNLNTAARRAILRSFESADQALFSLREMIRANPDFRFDEWTRRALLAGSATRNALGDISIIDARGNLLNSSQALPPANFSNEPFFFFHERSKSDRLFIAKTVTRSPLQDPIVVLSRRLTDRKGNFSGVATFSLRIASLLPLLQTPDLGEKGAISLYATDGTLLLRVPAVEGSVGRNYVTTPMFWQLATAKGLFTAVSPVDHIDRLVSASHVDHLPLIVAVGLSVEEIYAGWNRLAIMTGLAFTLLAASVIGLSVLLGLELRRRRYSEQRYRTLAHVDGLTGLYNRRRFDMVLEREFEEALHHATPLSVIMIDVDRFKLFNDLYGHQAGDECLKSIAEAIKTRLKRAEDIAARYGGEELAIILPGTDASGAEAVAEHLRLAIAELSITHARSHTGHVTASLGAATYDVSASFSPMTPAELVAAADQALYGAKRSGRNRVVTHTVLQCGIPATLPANEVIRVARVGDVLARLTDDANIGLDRVSRMAAQAFSTSMAFVTLVERTQHRFIGKTGLEAETIHRNNSFCAHALEGADALVVLDMARDIRFSGNILVREEPGIRFYAGAPLIDDKTGVTLGTLCIADQTPRMTFSDDQRELLLGFANLAMEQLRAVMLQPELSAEIRRRAV